MGNSIDKPGYPGSIDWPAVIKCAGEDELTYVSSGQVWASDADLHACRYRKDDYLVDSRGRVFRIVGIDNGVTAPVYTGDIISQASFINLLRDHAAVAGQCCIEKIVTGSVAEGIALVQSLSDA